MKGKKQETDERFWVPCCFLIFINDLPLWIRNSVILMFADDTKISRKVSKVEDGFLLQQDLDCLMEWSKYWRP